MNIFERFFPKKIEKTRITNENVEAILEKKMRENWEEVNKNFNSEKINKTIQKILTQVEILNNAKEEREIHKKLLAISTSAKNNVCVTTKKEIQNLNFTNLKEFYTQTKTALENIAVVTTKYDERLELAYSKSFSKMWKELKKLHTHYDNVKDTAEKAVKKEKKIKEKLETIRGHDRTKNEIGQLKNQIIILEKEIGKQNEKQELLKKELEQINTPNSEIMENQISTTKNEIEQILNNLQPAFYHYKNMTTPKNKKIIERNEFQQQPEKTNQILNEIKSKIINGEIVLDEKRKERAQNSLNKNVNSLFEKMEEQELTLNKERIKNKPIIEKIRRLKTEKENGKQKTENKTREIQTLKTLLKENQEKHETRKIKMLKIKNEL